MKTGFQRFLPILWLAAFFGTANFSTGGDGDGDGDADDDALRLPRCRITIQSFEILPVHYDEAQVRVKGEVDIAGTNAFRFDPDSLMISIQSARLFDAQGAQYEIDFPMCSDCATFGDFQGDGNLRPGITNRFTFRFWTTGKGIVLINRKLMESPPMDAGPSNLTYNVFGLLDSRSRLPDRDNGSRELVISGYGHAAVINKPKKAKK